ncbi:MAG TPA: hypothetical protein VHX49_04325 [Candidatus Acidoferrales bacterium]|nr:hypothetical protein [Candidatus Acidoferrales bacterium]
MINAGGRSPWPRYLAWVVVVGALVLVGRLAWQGSRYFLRPQRTAVVAPIAPTAPSSSSAEALAPWEHEMLVSIDAAIGDAKGGQMIAAEMDVDRAALVATDARLQSRAAKPDFFTVAVGEFDRVLASGSGDADLVDHVTQARIALAELRSSQSGRTETQAKDELAPIAASAAAAKRDVKKISIDAPRELDADSVLDPSTLGGDYLDASFMPETSEILLPPATRAFADNIRVENLTIAGAAQTLDGIHWRNVTFVGTHLRYESGELDLEDVHFVNCRFGFPSDEGGARLANAIALGQTSITIEQAGAKPTTP